MVQHGSVLDQVAKMAFKSHTISICIVHFGIKFYENGECFDCVICNWKYLQCQRISVAIIGITRVELGSASE
jgi:hypothetical protein